MARRSEKRRSSSWREVVLQRLRGVHRLLAVALATLLLILVNLLAARLDLQWRFKTGGTTGLSERARTLVAATRGEIEVKVLLPRNHHAFEPLRQLLENLHEAADESGGAQLSIEYVDPHRDLARAAQLAQRYEVAGWQVLFIAGQRFERVALDEMVETIEPRDNAVIPTAPRHQRFRGEQLCVTALARLARPRRPQIYSLTGHGERNFDSYDSLQGYSDFAREIRREGYLLQPLQLGEQGRIPDDCDLLLVAGPQHAPLPEEQAILESWLVKGGRMMLLIDRAATIPNGWEGVLGRLGLRFANLTAVGGRTLGGFHLVVDSFGDHPIARDLQRSGVYFVNPQVIEPVNNDDLAMADRPRAEVVVAAPENAWGETDPDTLPRRYDPECDRRGLLPLVVAVELGAGMGEDVGLRAMRAVVFGDSNCGVNGVLAGGRTGNRDLLLNAINWLTESGLPSATSLMAEGEVLQLGMSRRRQIRHFMQSVVYWPLLVALSGLAFVKIRQR